MFQRLGWKDKNGLENKYRIVMVSGFLVARGGKKGGSGGGKNWKGKINVVWFWKKQNPNTEIPKKNDSSSCLVFPIYSFCPFLTEFFFSGLHREMRFLGFFIYA